MKKIWIFILFLAINCQLSAVSGQQTFSESENLRTVESESWQKSESHKVARSQSDCLSDTATLRLCDSATLRPYDFYESQIRLADSLYKNYLPQYNFEEVKAAMEFFDSVQLSAISRQRWRLFNKKTDNENKLIAESRLLTAAKAHYYHAVGLTERDDIVGACEHYFIALEIMEFEIEKLKTSKSEKRSQSRKVARSQSDCLSDSATQIPCDPETLRPCDLNKEDYEKNRFLSLVYTRLGELFLSEDYCNLAISKYKKALKYVLLLGESKAVANTYKCLGNSYQLYDMPDSALYYYNMSIKTDSNLTNRLDVEKSIAKILFNKGEKDKAYILLKNNLNKLDNYIAKDSYYVTLGEMYYSDLIYDSATYFLNISSNSNNYSIKATSLGLLSTIHDSIGNQIEKAACDNILSKILLKSSNKTIHSSQLQSVYDEYKERKYEREKLEKNRKTYMTLLMFAFFIVSTFVILLFLWYINKRRSKILMTTILDNENLIIRINEDIKQKETEIERLSEDNLNKGKVIDDYIENIEKTTTEINELKKDVNEKEIRIGELLENIKAKDEQISNYKEQTVNAIKADINSYYETEICEKILLEVKYKNTNKVKKITLNKLKPKEIVSLKYAANSTLNHLLNKITSNYRKIDNEDLICICLLLLDISITDISELMGKSYNAVWTRITKIKNTFKLDADSNLQSFLLGLL